MLRLLTRYSRSSLLSSALRQPPTAISHARRQYSHPGHGQNAPAKETNKGTASKNKLKVDHSRFVAEAHQNDDWPEGSQKQGGGVALEEKRVQVSRRGTFHPNCSEAPNNEDRISYRTITSDRLSSFQACATTAWSPAIFSIRPAQGREAASANRLSPPSIPAPLTHIKPDPSRSPLADSGTPAIYSSSSTRLLPKHSR